MCLNFSPDDSIIAITRLGQQLLLINIKGQTKDIVEGITLNWINSNEFVFSKNKSGDLFLYNLKEKECSIFLENKEHSIHLIIDR
jgi:hypothetical protein